MKDRNYKDPTNGGEIITFDAGQEGGKADIKGNFYHIKVCAFFDNLSEKNNFINKWQKSIDSFDVSKEELNAN